VRRDDAQRPGRGLLGSRSEKVSIRGAPLGADFLFQTRQGPRRRGDFGILNLHPAAPPGSTAYWGAKQLEIIDRLCVDRLGASTATPCAVRSCWRLHYLRQADFASDRNPIGELLPRIRDADRRLTEFAASRHVRVNRGVPVEPRVGRSERTRGVRPGAGRSLSQFGYVDSERPERELRGTDRLGTAR
jgi:hypothetical protein